MKKSVTLTILVIFLNALSSIAQLTGYVEEGFEGSSFPPAGWTKINETGGYEWAVTNTKAHNGTQSALIRYENTTGQDWLITPRYHVGSATDSVFFYMRLAYTGYAPDSLCVKVSVTDASVASFTGTLLKLAEGVNYPANASDWYQYKVSLKNYVGQDIYIAFKHYNMQGDGLYLDDVAIGTKPDKEIETRSVNMPSSTAITPRTPVVTYANKGQAGQSFNVTLTVSPGGYSSTKTVTTLSPGSSVNVFFDTWTPDTAGSFIFKAYSSLQDDENKFNDTLLKTVDVLTTFPNKGWSARTSLPAARWATSPVFAKPCIADEDTGYVYMIGGNDESFGSASGVLRFNITTETWDKTQPLPTLRGQITPVKAGNKIYVIGGYTGAMTPTNKAEIYDIPTDTWSSGASLPTAVGDHASAVYADSLIYIISGNTGNTDVNTVQIYNVRTNAWTTGTPKPGTAVAGGRMGITGNKIVFTGGYSQAKASGVVEAFLGTINLTDPTSITWEKLPDYPGGTASRLAGGVAFEENGRVYFGGGDPNGQGTDAKNEVYAYNVTSGSWEIGPVMPLGKSNISGFTGIVENDTLYLVTAGGFSGSSLLSDNSWLLLGPARPQPYAQKDTGICKGGSTTLRAYNGLSYIWTPSQGLSSAVSESPVASPASTTTYQVSMDKGYGCPAREEITVTVNELPSVTFASLASVCENTAAFSLTGGAPAGGTYSGPGVAADNFDPAAAGSGDHILTYSYTDANQCAASESALITVKAPPAIHLEAFDNVCNNASPVVLTGGFPLGGYYTVNGVTAESFDPSLAGTGPHSITYHYTDANNCSASVTSEILVDVCTGLKTPAAASFSIYPNPGTGIVYIEGKGAGIETGKLYIYNAAGTLLDTKYLDGTGGSKVELDMGRFGRGVYLIRLVSDKEIQTSSITLVIN